jgi:hypothetical protein
MSRRLLVTTSLWGPEEALLNRIDFNTEVDMLSRSLCPSKSIGGISRLGLLGGVTARISRIAHRIRFTLAASAAEDPGFIFFLGKHKLRVR